MSKFQGFFISRLWVFFIFSLFPWFSFATVDYDDEISIVFEGAQGDLSVRKLPFVGCMGIPTECTVQMFTFDYKIPSGGCGQKFRNDFSVNFLSCAKLDVSMRKVRLKDGSVLQEADFVRLDLNSCSFKLKDFDDHGIRKVLKLSRKALKHNFPKARTFEIVYRHKSYR